uniref:Uncharacterized protein n=1 Tax=Cucumis melo TaxID=3656 RepID=A0A9I9EGG1_CUCME
MKPEDLPEIPQRILLLTPTKKYPHRPPENKPTNTSQPNSRGLPREFGETRVGATWPKFLF